MGAGPPSSLVTIFRPQEEQGPFPSLRRAGGCSYTGKTEAFLRTCSTTVFSNCLPNQTRPNHTRSAINTQRMCQPASLLPLSLPAEFHIWGNKPLASSPTQSCNHTAF